MFNSAEAVSRLSVGLLKHIPQVPLVEGLAQARQMPKVRRQLLALIAGRQENRYTARNQHRGHWFDRLTIEPDVENRAIEYLLLYRSECWLQTPERANDLRAQSAENVLDLHRYEELILDNQNSPALERLLHGSILNLSAVEMPLPAKGNRMVHSTPSEWYSTRESPPSM